eukprot:m.47664 g.47664  ORF g.47664 m.47664 type:complete len:525 (+) comp10988_c0_seq1:257-1831(+)
MPGVIPTQPHQQYRERGQLDADTDGTRESRLTSTEPTVLSQAQLYQQGQRRRQQQSEQQPLSPGSNPSSNVSKRSNMAYNAKYSGKKDVRSNPLRIALLLVAAALGLWYLVLHHPAQDYFAVMIDAGSTGSRVHVFRFRSTDPLDGWMELQTDIFKQVKPGLSSYAGDAGRGAMSLLPLLDLAMTSVPSDRRHMTPINVKATAGLRLLDGNQADEILDETRKLLQTYPFLYDPEDAVEIMGGADEGLFAWVTVNYLLEKLDAESHQTCVVLDLGGGSTQIAIASSQDSVVSDLRDTFVMGSTHRMYLYSHLSYGLMAGRALMLAFELSDADPKTQGKASITSPCVASPLKYSYGKRSFDVSASGSASYDECHVRAIAVVHNPSGSFATAPKQPPITPGQPIFAMSYYFDRATQVGLIPEASNGEELSVTAFADVAKDVCGLDAASVMAKYPLVDDAETAAFLCTDLCFITALLEHGFGIGASAPVRVAKQIEYNGEAVETQWPLGASLGEISEELGRLHEQGLL